MKVRELKRLLEGADDEREVVLAWDAEGNGFSPLAHMSDGLYCASAERCGGMLMLEKLNDDDCGAGFIDADLEANLDLGVPALALWPVE